MEHIRHYLIINAPIGKVYEAITTQEGLSNWWTADTIAKPEIGFLNEFKFGNNYHNKMRVKVLDENQLIVWICEDGDREWINTKISFKLSVKGDKTVLQFSQENWADTTEFYASCNYNWGRFMASLQSLCETGTGKAFEA
jgi:uncharacterized protein YndB with AHSA1/START domain